MSPGMHLRRFLAAVVCAATCGAVLAQAAEGGRSTDTVNPFHPRYAHPYRHGAVPTREAHENIKAWAGAHPHGGQLETPALPARVAGPGGGNTLSYMGGIAGAGVTTGSPRVYVVFWGSQWGNPSVDSNGYLHFPGDPRNAAPYVQALIKGLGTNGEQWSGVMTQYCDGVSKGATTCPASAAHVPYPSANVLAGVWYDGSAAAPAQATDSQIAAEAVRAAAHFGNTTAAANRNAQYIIFSPTGTHPDGFGTLSGNFCAWHDYNGDTTLSGGPVFSPYGNIAFTNLPYVSDLGSSCGAFFVSSALDGFSLVAGHEYAETLTDQYPAGGWINNTGSANTGYENADECAWIRTGQGASALVTLATGTFAMQSTWSNDTNRCDIAHAVVGAPAGGQPAADFTFAASALTVSFTDRSTDSGGTIGSRIWSFGDGGSSVLQNPTHVYAAAGTYTVSETVTDSVSAASSTRTAPVTVSAGGGTPVAGFSVAVNGLTATFTDTSTDPGGTIGSRSWSFGDGATSTVQNPVHAYAASGTYTVTESVFDSVNGSSSSRSVALTVTAPPQPAQLIVNPGFESGTPAPWAISGGKLCGSGSCPGASAYAGSWFAWLGGLGSAHQDILSQQVTLPAGRQVTLNFFLHVDTMERLRTTADTLSVQLSDSAGQVLGTLGTYSNRDAAPGYARQSFDLSAFAGRAVTVRFVATENASAATTFLVDNVTVDVQ